MIAAYVILAVLVAAGWYAFERQAAIYEQMVALLEKDREAARAESKVFRGLLFPGVAKIEMSADSRGQAAPPPSAAPVNPMLNRRVPFRLRWKQAVKLSNTKQMKTDALASALQKQEVPHAESR